MSVFWSGIALGMGIGIPIMLALLALGLIIFAIRLLWWFVSYAIPQFASGWPEGSHFREAWREGRERGARYRERGRQMRERQLAWLERYRATRWYAHLNRRLFG
jgi:hypothetical protein